jgi:rhamnose utilization protein RhaD (predicted bifunctional aldolase and dehydrogenase)
MVDHANLLLRQMRNIPKVRYTLTPNQHVGAWKVSFMPQWIAREFLGRRGNADFRPEDLVAARCPLLGYSLKSMEVEGATMPDFMLRTDEQPEIGPAAYDAGAKILADFFHRELQQYRKPNLDPVGQKILDCCFANGSVKDYEDLMRLNG